ncbi:MAG: type VI secretion system lipoprotein TssJ [Pseudomonadaceae bacterium]|nr:MAG: type VI secretion system lipoprotein TssJ [Pseudomonadaceae bacterium]
MITMRTSLIILLCSLLALSACSSVSRLSPWSDLTKLDLTLEASSDLNPDLNQRPSPVVVQLFELRHPSTFANADFFSLYQQPKQTLSLDLLGHEELEVRPGQELELKLTTHEDSRYLGVIVAYRDMTDAEWRAVVPLNQQAQNQTTLNLDANGIRQQDSQRSRR